MASEEIDRNITYWRKRVREDTLTVEEMVEALSLVRKERIGADAVSKKSTSTKAAAKAKGTPIDSDDLLKDLMG